MATEQSPYNSAISRSGMKTAISENADGADREADLLRSF